MLLQLNFVKSAKLCFVLAHAISHDYLSSRGRMYQFQGGKNGIRQQNVSRHSVINNFNDCGRFGKELPVNCYRGRRVAEFPSSPKLFGFNLKLLKVTNFTEMQTKIFAKLINWATKCKQWTVLSYLFAISIINAQTIIAKALLDHTIHLPQQNLRREQKTKD